MRIRLPCTEPRDRSYYKAKNSGRLQQLKKKGKMKINLSLILSFAGALSASAASFTYSDFSSTAGLNLVGNAAQTGNFVRLTPATTAQYGTMWYNASQPVASGFTTT